MGYDINDAHKQGADLTRLRASAQPMDTSKHQAQMGSQLIAQAVSTAQETEDSLQRQQIFLNLLANDMAKLQAAWAVDEHAITASLWAVKRHKGMGAIIETFIKALKKGERAKKKKDRRKEVATTFLQKQLDGADEPEEHVLQAMDRKMVKENGEFVCWGEPYQKWHNYDPIFRTDTRMKGRIRHNILSGMTELDGEPLRDHVVDKVRMWVSKTYQVDLGNKECGRAMDLVGRQHPINPVKNWLLNLPAWDGKERIMNFWPKYFGAEDTLLHRLFGQFFFVGGIARVMEPGCKLDTVPILIGKTGLFKSTAIRYLCPDHRWWSDTPFDLGNKDAFLSIQGMWIYELSEVEQVFDKGFSKVKNFLSSPRDRYRAPYAHYTDSVPRCTLFVGTTNVEELNFLSDPSSTRRYWPIKCGDFINLEDIKRDRDQLWAEALYLWNVEFDKKAPGESYPWRQWWLPQELEDQAHLLCKQYAEQDPWEEAFLHWFDHRCGKEVRFTIKQIMAEALHFKDEQIQRLDKRSMIRATQALRRLDCQPSGKQRVVAGKRIREWIFVKADAIRR
jgi:hypothetical protein